MTPDRDPDTTQAVPRHTGTGHVPAVDPALAEQRLLGIVDRLLALADEWDAKGAKIWGQIGLLDLDGALAGLKAVGAAAHQAHAQAIREAILGAPATAEGRRA